MSYFNMKQQHYNGVRNKYLLLKEWSVVVMKCFYVMPKVNHAFNKTICVVLLFFE